MSSSEILHLDDDLVAINKPSGWLVHRSASSGDGPIAMHIVRDQIGGWVYPVHRLDRGTSGVLLFARSAEVATQLQRDWGEAQKRYFCIVRGRPAIGLLDHPVPNDEGGPLVEARTEVESVRYGAFPEAPRPHGYSVVRALLKTGRRHQIRRHLKHAGSPLIGDTTYGRSEHNRYFKERFGLERLALHAEELVIAGLVLRAPLPSDLLRASGWPDV